MELETIMKTQNMSIVFLAICWVWAWLRENLSEPNYKPYAVEGALWLFIVFIGAPSLIFSTILRILA